MERELHAGDTPVTMLMQDTHIPVRSTAGGRGGTRLHEPARTDSVPLTIEAWRTLERELDSLRERRSREIPARLRAAREFGDPVDNDEYLAVREDEAMLAARIARLEDILMRAVVIDPADGDDAVAIGSHVSVVDVDTGETLEYEIDGAHDARRPKTVSALSPVGKALLGRSPGDHVRIELPNRRARELKLREIRPMPAT